MGFWTVLNRKSPRSLGNSYSRQYEASGNDGRNARTRDAPAPVADMDDRTRHRLLAVGSLVGALAHALAPRALLTAVEVWYNWGLKAEFEPTEPTVRRVRWLAVTNALAAVYFWRRAADADST